MSPELIFHMKFSLTLLTFLDFFLETLAALDKGFFGKGKKCHVTVKVSRDTFVRYPEKGYPPHPDQVENNVSKNVGRHVQSYTALPAGAQS